MGGQSIGLSSHTLYFRDYMQVYRACRLYKTSLFVQLFYTPIRLKSENAFITSPEKQPFLLSIISDMVIGDESRIVFSFPHQLR